MAQTPQISEQAPPPAPAAPAPARRVHPALRWPLRAYKGFVVSALAGLLFNWLYLLLANGFSGFFPAAASQVRALLDFMIGRPFVSAVIALALVATFVLSVVAEREYEAEVKDNAAAETKDVAAQVGGAAGSVAGAEAGAVAGTEAGTAAAVAVVQQAAEELARAAAAGQRARQRAPAVPDTVVSPSGLPRPATLIGREGPLAALMDALRSGNQVAVGVFAVEGLGGVGKTALAAEAVARLSAEEAVFPGGAAWISCEGLAGAAGLAELWARVARALGAEAVAALADPEARRSALRAALADPARPRLLLALDNLEPGLDADAVLDTLAGGRATLLLTARGVVAPNRLIAFALQPLADPAAVTLFGERLRQVDPSRPTPEEQPRVAALAGLLGGLPLAIELAAAYAGVQKRPLADLIAEVRADGLAAEALRDPKRGVALRFARSYEALTAPQQRLFAGLSLLAGASFPRAAALALAEAARQGTESVDAQETPAADLDALVGLALLEAQANGRLRLHPLLREYAAERLRDLGTEVEGRLGDAAVAYWLTYAQAHPGYDGMDALEDEAAGLMGALTWAQAHERHRDIVNMAYALNRYWFVRGRVDEANLARPWALEAAEALGDTRDRQFMQHELALRASQTGRIEEARAGYMRAGVGAATGRPGRRAARGA